MATPNEIHFDSLCRTCMHEVADATTPAVTTELAGEHSEHQWQSIYDIVTEYGALRIAELLTSTTPQLKMQLSDELPNKICHQCLGQLLNAYRFQQMCLQSDQQMRDLLTQRCVVTIANETTVAANAEIEQKIVLKQPLVEMMVNTREEDIRSEPATTLLETPLINTTDPLQSLRVDEAWDRRMKTILNSTSTAVSSYLKMELCEDKFKNVEHVVEETMTLAEHAADVCVKMENVTAIMHRESTIATDDIACRGGDASEWVDGKSKLRRSMVTRSTKPLPDVALKEKRRKEKSMPEVLTQDNTAKSTFKCSICDKSFSSHRYLQKHVRRHKTADERKISDAHSANLVRNVRFKCDVCTRYFNKPETLYKHRQIHAGSAEMEASMMRFVCELCPKKYSTQRMLTRHKRERHRNGNPEATTKLYACEYCNKSFQQSGTLKDHLRTHTGEQPYLCSECGKAFNSSSNMKQHLLRHTGVKRYECPNCPKKFPCLSDLASHKAVHQQIKPHICDVCGAAFGKPYQLKKHKMYHNGDKPYKCEYCEMCFVCMDHQRRHMRTHTGEKPYKCKYCERAFAQSNDLIKHLRSHLGENVYKCELCPRAFRLAAELRTHFAVHKNEDEETRAQNMQALMEEEEKLCLSLAAGKSKPMMVNGKQEHQPTIAIVQFDT